MLCEYLGRKEGFGQAGGEIRGRGLGSWEHKRGAWPAPSRLGLESGYNPGTCAGCVALNQEYGSQGGCS